MESLDAHNSTSTYIYIYKGASPRGASARLGSAHARNYRGCRQIEAVNATQYCQGVPSKINRV